MDDIKKGQEKLNQKLVDRLNVGNDTKVQEKPNQELVDEFEMDVDAIIPSMKVSKNLVETEPKECIVEDEVLLNLYDEILGNCRQDRDQCTEVMTNFLDMVMNDGDASSASKEAIVNLLKVKTDLSDKMSKVADLMTRIKLKEKDTFPRYLAAQQQNHIHLGESVSKRELIKLTNKVKKKAEGNGE